jgi:hypothetical protein
MQHPATPPPRSANFSRRTRPCDVAHATGTERATVGTDCPLGPNVQLSAPNLHWDRTCNCQHRTSTVTERTTVGTERPLGPNVQLSAPNLHWDRKYNYRHPTSTRTESTIIGTERPLGLNVQLSAPNVQLSAPNSTALETELHCRCCFQDHSLKPTADTSAVCRESLFLRVHFRKVTYFKLLKLKVRT